LANVAVAVSRMRRAWIITLAGRHRLAADPALLDGAVS
jgi:hypothetical protein